MPECSGMHCCQIHKTHLQARLLSIKTHKCLSCTVSSRLKKQRRLWKISDGLFSFTGNRTWKFSCHLRGEDELILVFLMSRIHETSRGGVGASEVTANCHHADRVCVKGPRGEVTTLTFCMLETQEELFTGCLHVKFPSEEGKISETLPGLRSTSGPGPFFFSVCGALTIFFLSRPVTSFQALNVSLKLASWWSHISLSWPHTS